VSRSTIPPAQRTANLLDAEGMREVPRIARNAAELVLLGLAEIPLEIDRVGVAERLQQAIGDCYVALDTAPEEPAHGDALRQAMERVHEARELLLRANDGAPRTLMILERPVRILEDAQQLLARRAEEATELQLRALNDARRWMLVRAYDDDPKLQPRPFRASKGVPQLHHIKRGSVHASIPLGSSTPIPPAPPPPPAVAIPKTLDELAAFRAAVESGALAKTLAEPPDEETVEPPRPVEYAYEPAVDEQEALRTLARDTLEDIASLGNLRKPIPTETWLDQAPFEQRLLDNLDYFVSLGRSVLPLVTIYRREADPPDPHRAFALAFTLGCIEGRDTVGTIVASLKTSVPEELPGFVDGLVLAPNGAIDELLVELLGHPNRGLVGVAVDVLGARAALPDDTVRWIRERRDLNLDRKLARALAICGADDVAIVALEEMLLTTADDGLFDEAARSLLRRGHGATRDRMRDVLSDPRANAARRDTAATLLAITGQPDDSERLATAARTAPSTALVRALGRFGHLDHVPLLIDLLESDHAEAAGEALDRITAAGLRHIVEERWDTGLPTGLIEEAERAGAIVPMRKMEKVILDAAAWSAWSRDELPRLDRRRKHRGGVPFRASHVIDELVARATPPSRRDEAAFELACVLGARVRFRTDDWVARQQTHLEELREDALRIEDVPGCWLFAGGASPHDAWSWEGTHARGASGFRAT
jgi:hypothetical protein